MDQECCYAVDHEATKEKSEWKRMVGARKTWDEDNHRLGRPHSSFCEQYNCESVMTRWVLYEVKSVTRTEISYRKEVADSVGPSTILALPIASHYFVIKSEAGEVRSFISICFFQHWQTLENNSSYHSTDTQNWYSSVEVQNRSSWYSWALKINNEKGGKMACTMYPTAWFVVASSIWSGTLAFFWAHARTMSKGE